MYALLIVVCPFALFLLAIMLSVLLLYTVSNCPFGILKLPVLLLEKCLAIPWIQLPKPSTVPSFGIAMHDVASIKLSIQKPNNQSI
jgi:hypothetical protein